MVLFVSYSGMLGGAERLLIDYASGLAGESCLACPQGRLADAATAAGLRVFPRPARSLKLRGGLRTPVGASFALAAHAREIRMLARSLEPELVVAWGMRSGIAATAAGAPFVFQHNDLLPGPGVGAAVRLAARRARCTITLSHAIAAELPGGVVVVHPGIDLDAFAGYERAPADPPEVLVLGALVEWKRPDLALKALALARRRVPELRLRLVGATLDGLSGAPPEDGGDELLRSLRARAAEADLDGAVSFDGFVADPREALARATCLLHCAPREPFGLAVLEALASARPAVVPAACGPAEIVDETCGVLYEPGDASAAAAALAQLASDRELAARMGLRGRRRAGERFDRDRARARFAQLISAAAGTAAPHARASAAESRSLALVTVTHDSALEVTALLASVTRHLPGAEVVVVDCASRDGTPQLARQQAGVTTIALEENIGFGRACNMGVARAKAPVVALVNPDVELLDASLLALAAEAVRDDRPERLLAPRVLNRDGSVQDTAHPVPGSAADLIRSLVPPAAMPGWPGVELAPWRSSRPRRIGWATGCALVAQRRTLQQLGPFDESMFLYGEDLELGLRAQRQGIVTWLWPSARVLHHRARSTSRAFGGEPFQRLARGRHDAVARGLGARRALLDDRVQMVTFASRLALKRALGQSAERERRQLEAVMSLRRSGAG